MASRDKKPTLGKKQGPDASTSNKETVIATSTNQNDVGKIIKKRNINPTRKVTAVRKRKLTVKMKAKDKKPQLSKKMVNVIISNAEIKKNGLSLPTRKIIKKKPDANSVPTEPVSVDKKTKKVVSATVTKTTKTDNTESLSKIDETINSILKQIRQDEDAIIVVKNKKPRVKKLKKELEVSETTSDVSEHPVEQDTISKTIEDVIDVRYNTSEAIDDAETLEFRDTVSETIQCVVDNSVECDTISETIEDVMKDLATLLKSQEEASKVIDNGNTEEKKQEHLITLQDNIKIDASAKHLIDMLDLSVSKDHELIPPEVCIRRHSIEKLPDSKSNSLFSNITPSNISKISRTSRVRSSVDGVVKRFSPYNTRSDAPTPKLRSGRPRKMKENLLEGIIETKKRRKRLGSEYSGSEKSKLSECESDGSFSDVSTISKKDSKIIITNGLEDDSKSESVTDDNSNLYTNDASEINNEPSLTDSCPPKVPDKSTLLEVLNHSSNEVNTDQEKSETIELVVVPTEQFYGLKSKCDDVESSNGDLDLKVIKPQENGDVADNKDDLSLQSPKPNAQFVIEEAILQSKVEEIIKSMEEEDLSEPMMAQESEPMITQESEPMMAQESNTSGEQPSIEEETIKSDDQDPNADNHVSEDNKSHVEQTQEMLEAKENILQALGLHSLKAIEEAKQKEKLLKPEYTGSLKTVIKLNRVDKHKRRNILKYPAYKYEVDGHDSKSKESSSNTWQVQQSQSAHSSDTAGAPRKSHNSNRINMDGSSEHNSDAEPVTPENDDSYTVVIPEKASSFSVHPGRLCKDECSYCFGKFGLFDTPCHIAQMKSGEKQHKILETEKHLTRDSCLCDACYRHVDRKSNTPSYLNKGSKRNSIIAPGPRQNHCHVLSCSNVASHILRRKWIIKMRKSVSKLINIDLDNLGLHSIPICDDHYAAVEHLMICAMCKRRLTRNQIHYLGPETNDLNAALNAAGIPVKLFDKPVVCKLCRYFASLILRNAEDRPDNTNNFFRDYRRRLLHFHNIEVMEEIEEEEDMSHSPIKEKNDKEAPVKKRKKLHHKSTNNLGPPVLEPQVDIERLEPVRSGPSDSNSTGKSRSESPTDYMVDYNTLIPSIAMECGSDQENTKKTPKPQKNKPIHISSNASISVRELFPGEDELGLQCHIDFGLTKEKTPEGWERCNTVIQYDSETKLLWQELQKPYGNQSSFLRHLVLLEKYFRGGDLILAPNASHHSSIYSEAVQNRLRAYDNIPKSSLPSTNHSSSSSSSNSTKDTPIINAANIPKNTPITITQINSLTPTIVNKTRVPPPPPALISLHPGTTRPKTPALIKTLPQTSRIKIPMTQNWRPTLIPIDPAKKTDKDKKPGYVKVVSNSKPYFITVDDYNRMCAIKKSYDLKQKRLLEASQKIKSNPIKSLSIRKGLIVTKTTPAKVELEPEHIVEKPLENNEPKLTNCVVIAPKIPKSLTVIPQSVHDMTTLLNNSTTTNNS